MSKSYNKIITYLRANKSIAPVLLMLVYCAGIAFTVIGWVMEQGGSITIYLVRGHYLAFLFLAINLISYFFVRPAYKYLLILTVAFGLFGLIEYSPRQWTWWFSINDLHIEFHPAAVLMGIVAYGVTFQKVNNFLVTKLFTEVNQRKDLKEAEFRKKVAVMRTQYGDASDKELYLILADRQKLPEIREAARQILRQRDDISLR